MQYVPVAIGGGKSVLIDLSKHPGLEDLPGVSVCRRFDIQTYGKARNSGVHDIGWKLVFTPINNFLQTLSVDHQRQVAMAILTMHRRILDSISQMNNKTAPGIIRDIGKVTIELDKAIGLCDQLRHYTNTHTPVGDFSKAGTRPHHRPEYTFHEAEAAELLTVVMLCKLLAPLFGSIINIVSTSRLLDKDLKEIYAANLLQPIFTHRYAVLIEKLDNYIAHMIEVNYQSAFTGISSVAMRGSTTSTLALKHQSSIYVKGLVNIDLNHKGGNVVAYICEVVHHAVNTHPSDISQKGGVTVRISPDDMSTEEWGSSMSIMEQNSLVSKQPSDTIFIANALIPLHVDRLLKERGLSKEMHTEMCTFYRSYLFPVTPLNHALVSTVFSGLIGGAKTIELLSAPNLIPLVTAVQLWAFVHRMPHLGHLLTATTSSLTKDLLTDEEHAIQRGYGNHFAFNNCRDKFSPSHVVYWEQAVIDIMEYVTTTTWHYNTAPVVWQQGGIGGTGQNGQPIALNRSFTAEFTKFVQAFL